MKVRIIACLALCTLQSFAWAQDAEEGAELYNAHCATCHGLDADGKGPMAPALLLRPPSLSDLSARNDGVFPDCFTIQSWYKLPAEHLPEDGGYSFMHTARDAVRLIRESYPNSKSCEASD